MKVIIAGSRKFNNYEQLNSICSGLAISEVISGMATSGADILGANWAIDNNIPLKRFPANWELYGRQAGHKRNAQMAKYGDSLIAFWDGESRGTNNMINLMSKVYNKPTLIVYYETGLIIRRNI